MRVDSTLRVRIRRLYPDVEDSRHCRTPLRCKSANRDAIEACIATGIYCFRKTDAIDRRGFASFSVVKVDKRKKLKLKAEKSAFCIYLIAS